MDKRVYIFFGIIFFLDLVGFVLYSNLEIFESTTQISPSIDVTTNSYYAMERWLKETGHPVRFEKNFSPSKFAAVKERVAIIHASESRWDNAEKFIIPWIKQGGCLIISIEYYEDSLDENLSDFFSSVGITVLERDSKENVPWNDFISDEFVPKEPIPKFGGNVYFSYSGEYKAFDIKDNLGYIRLVELSIGNGMLAVTGRPSFMNNNYLKDEENAKLAWKLTGARAGGNNKGVLFVRERHIPKNMFGKIMERGNLFPVVISALFLIVLGFWMVIPVFGLTAVEKQTTSRPIRERFIAEIRFLKKYRALDHYLDVYEREQKSAGISENKKAYNYRELINQYRRIFNGTAKF
jgi:hypothetical protein